jgi:TIR domain-containing protein
MQYLASVETGVGNVCQGLVHFPDTPRLKTFYPSRWFETVLRLGRAHAGIPGCQVSLRTNLRKGRLDQLALFRAAASEEAAMRHYLTGYLRMIALVPDSVALPADQAAHNNLSSVWAEHLCRIPLPAYRVNAPGQPWFACDFRVQDFLPELLEEADAAGHDLLHQINFQTWYLTAEEVRKAAHNFVALQMLKGPSPQMLELQKRLLMRTQGEVILVSEEVGCSSPVVAEWLRLALERHFSQRYGPLKFTPPRFDFQTALEFETEVMAYGFHPGLIDPPSTEELFVSAVGVEQIGRAFDWTETLKRWFEPPLAAEQSALRVEYEKQEAAEKQEIALVTKEIEQRQKPLVISDENSNYTFISYRRADFAKIEPILDALNGAGIPFWFDRGILAGDQWMSVLQEKIYNAKNFLLFLSQKAVESRYVQMEIHYAHSIDKPLIFPIMLEQLDLTLLPGGLGMMLGLKNVIPADQAKIIEHLREQERKRQG